MPHLIHPQYRPDIDGLRAVAILAVIGFHAFPREITGGFIGVDIFFVISGFLISKIIFSSLERQRFNLVEFYIRRIRRIFPALLLVMVVCFTVGWFILLADEFKQLSKHTMASVGFIQNLILWRESGYFDNAAEAKPLLHLWSLAVEEQFYIFWPLLLAFVWKLQWSFVKVSSFVAVVSFAVSIYLIYHSPSAAFYFPASRFWELMVGGILAFIELHRPTLIDKHRDGQSFLGFSLLIIGLLLLDKDSAFPGWWALLPTIGSFLIISAGSNALLNKKILSNKLMLWIGLISYPLYLWHWPILSYLKIAEIEMSVQVKILAISATVILSWATYKFIESPFRYSGNKIKQTLILLGLMLFLGILGFYSYTNNGLKNRSVNGGVVVKEYDFLIEYRHNLCFLDANGTSSFSDSCIGSVSDGKPMVMLWGDSHAASLYRGLLKQSSSKGFNLAQFTASGCPPVVDFNVSNRSQCQEINSYVMEKISEYHPDTVIMAAFWSLYDGIDGSNEPAGKGWNLLSDSAIEETIIKLKKLGIKNIYLIGHLPIFKTTQIKAGIKAFINEGKVRTYRSFDKQCKVSDDRIARIASKLNIKFISPIRTLCNKNGCLISTSLKEFKPLSWDYGHLTTNGSDYFVEKSLDRGTLHLPSSLER